MMADNPSSSSRNTLILPAMANPPSQPRLFHQLKPLTVPILGMLPIKNAVQSIPLNPILASIQSIILSQSTPSLLTPPLIHYIFFPLEQLYHPANFQALTESCLNHLLKLSTTLVQLSKLHPSNPLWLSKETFLLNSIAPILRQRTGAVINSDTKNHPTSILERSDETITMALDLTMAILSPDGASDHSKPALDLANLYQVPSHLAATLPPPILRFLFEHLVDILDSLSRNFSGSAKQSQPSLSRATQTIQLVKLGLVRLSSSNLPGASGIDLLSTLLPSITSKLVQLACLLAQRHQFSGLLSSILHTIEWLLVECLDEELPDIQVIISLSEFQSVDQQLEPDHSSGARLSDQILEIASSWKKSNPSHSAVPSPPQVLESPAFHQSADRIVVKRDRSWLVFTSTKLALVLQRLSTSLDCHPNPIVLDAWVHMCCQLLDRLGTVLRIASPSSASTTDPAGGAHEKDGFRIVIESLLLHRSNTNINQERTVCSLAAITKSSPLASLQLLVDLVRANFRSLSNLLVKQVSGQDDQITRLTTQIISCLNLIIQLINHPIPSSQLQRAGLDSFDLGEFYQLLSLCMCRVELVIPRVLEFHCDALIPSSSSSGAFSITDHTIRGDSDSNNLPKLFPSLSVKQIFDVRCIKALEELIRTIAQLALHMSNSNLGNGGLSSWIRVSEITYLDHLLQLSTSTNCTTPSDLHTRSKQLNALWALGQSIRPSKSISRDDQQRERFRRIEVFCLQGLKKILDMAESHRVEGNAAATFTAAQAEGAKDSSSLIDKIDQDLDNLPVTDYLKGNYHHLSELEKFKPVPMTKGYQKINQDASFQTLRSCLILRLISSFAYVVEDSFQTNLSWILYYVLAQFGSPDPYLHQHATATLAELSFYCGYGSSANMLEDNSDYLIQVISQKLLPYQYDHHAPFVLEHLIRLVGLPFILPLIEQILLCDFFEILDDYHGYDLICQQLIGVFRCVMGLMNSQVEAEQVSNRLNILDAPGELNFEQADGSQGSTEKHGIDEIFEVEQELATARWALAGPASHPSHELDLFNKYQASRKRWTQVQKASNATEEECHKSKNRDKNPRKPFEEIEQVGSIDPDQDPRPKSPQLATPSPMTGYQKIATELINKSANFLTHPSPFVQISVSQLISLAIPILGSRAATPQESLLLPCIQKFWIVILNRLDQVYLSEKQSPSRSTDDDRIAGNQQHLIQIEVLHLFSSLCVHVGSFMNKKFANDVWPRIREIISEESKVLFAAAAGSALAGVHSTSVSLVRSCLETVLEVVRASARSPRTHDESIRFHEELVWDVVTCLTQLQCELRKTLPRVPIHKPFLPLLQLVDLICTAFVQRGFLGSVLVAQRAYHRNLEGLEFFSPSDQP